jgi:hypothetical protein
VTAPAETLEVLEDRQHESRPRRCCRLARVPYSDEGALTLLLISDIDLDGLRHESPRRDPAISARKSETSPSGVVDLVRVQERAPGSAEGSTPVWMPSRRERSSELAPPLTLGDLIGHAGAVAVEAWEASGSAALAGRPADEDGSPGESSGGERPDPDPDRDAVGRRGSLKANGRKRGHTVRSSPRRRTPRTNRRSSRQSRYSRPWRPAAPRRRLP